MVGDRMKVDIIGGSIGGLSTAISLKEHDPAIDVVVHEKYKEIGYNHEGRRCGEAHTVEREWSRWVPQKKSIFNTITKGEFTIGKKTYYAQEPAGNAFILNRQEFICQLGREAKQRGVVIQTDDIIRSIDECTGEYIVDASGCPSVVKRQLGVPLGFVGASYQQTLEDASCYVKDTMKIIFTPSFGYFWIFPRDPQKKEVNVGIGTIGDLGLNLKQLLEEFKQQQRITGTVNYVVGGLVPLGLQRPFLYQNILFVGDAGVGAFPFSGQGIYRALMSGEIAGRCLAMRAPERYPRYIRKEFLLWDVVGSLFVQVTKILWKINPQLFLTSYNLMAMSSKRFQSLTS